MSVINPHRCCPVCGDQNFTEFARVDADPAIGQDEDEAVYRCESQEHEFTSSDHVWDVHESDDYPHATDDPPATPLAAAGVTRRPYDGHTYTVDGPVTVGEPLPRYGAVAEAFALATKQRPDRPEWTDEQRIELARFIQNVAGQQLDLRLTTHRAAVLASAMLNAGWRR